MEYILVGITILFLIIILPPLAFLVWEMVLDELETIMRRRGK